MTDDIERRSLMRTAAWAAPAAVMASAAPAFAASSDCCQDQAGNCIPCGSEGGGSGS